MFKNTIKKIFISLLLVSIISCGGSDSSSNNSNTSAVKINPKNYGLDVNPIFNPSSIVNQTLPNNTKWTFMIYFAADNDLAEYAKKDLEELRLATQNPNIQVIFQTEYSDSLTTKRGVIKDNTITYFDIGNNLNMADKDTLTNFINWGKENYAADKYILSMWSHGLGWRFGGVQSDLKYSKGVLSDETSNSFMNIKDVGLGVKNAGGVDIAIFDACLMQMMEVGYSMKDAAKIMISSEDNVPVNGFPYTEILNNISNNSFSLANVASMIVDEYIKSYINSSNKISVHASSLDLSQILNLENSINKLSEILAPRVDYEKGNITQAKQQSADFYNLGHMDLIGFARQYQNITNDGDISDSLEQVIQSARQTVMYNKKYVPDGITSYNDKATGLAIYLPSPTQISNDVGLLAQYKTLDMNQNINIGRPWSDVLQNYTQAIDSNKRVIGKFDYTAVWNDANIDIDLFIQEPSDVLLSAFTSNSNSGNNGVFTQDSVVSKLSSESYFANANIEQGAYAVYVAYNGCSTNVLHPNSEVKIYYKDRQEAIPTDRLVGTYNLNCSNVTNIQAKDRAELQNLGNGTYSNFRFVQQITRY